MAKKWTIPKVVIKDYATRAIRANDPTILIGKKVKATKGWKQKKITLEPFMELHFVLPDNNEIFIGKDIYKESNICFRELSVPLITVVMETIMRTKKEPDEEIEQVIPKCFQVYLEVDDEDTNLFDYASEVFLKYQGKVYNLV